QLEAFAQGLVIDGADIALPCGARVRDEDVNAAETLHHLVESAAHVFSVRDVALHGQRCFADGLCDFRGCVQIEVEHGNFRAFGGHGFRSGCTDAGTAAGDDADLSGEN